MITPLSRTTLAVPMPPFTLPAKAPAPAPTLPCGTGPLAAALHAARPELKSGRAAPPHRPASAYTAALTISTMFSGLSRSVSRVPGAPPRCVTLAPTPWPFVPSASTTVAPVESGTVKCPTRMPGTSVMALLGPGTWAAPGVVHPDTADRTDTTTAQRVLDFMSSLRSCSNCVDNGERARSRLGARDAALASREFRSALLEERGEPFLVVVAGDRQALRVRFEIE